MTWWRTLLRCWRPENWSRVQDICAAWSDSFGFRWPSTNMPWPGDPRVNMQAGEGGKAKAHQVRQVVLAVEQLLGQQAKTATSE